MIMKMIDGVKVIGKSNDSDAPITDQELQKYVDYAKEEVSKIKEAKALTEVEVTVANGEASINYKYETIKFERIRRITGNRSWESPSNDTEIAA